MQSENFCHKMGGMQGDAYIMAHLPRVFPPFRPFLQEIFEIFDRTSQCELFSVKWKYTVTVKIIKNSGRNCQKWSKFVLFVLFMRHPVDHLSILNEHCLFK